ncbi:nucleoside-diphosphate-sugar epimerase [Bradyrhizobium sp. CIR18]|nr:nucleoside-diphosphate-sugar epimerase [Bradyrhizobium sp. CIR18]
MLSPDGCTGAVNLGHNSEFGREGDQVHQFLLQTHLQAAAASRSATPPAGSFDGKALLDWQPKVALDEGLQKTIAYFKEGVNLAK